MQKNPVTIGENRPIRDVVRLIFNLGVSAVLVTKEKKLMGIITEEDILQKVFPSVKDFMEDYFHARNFEFMEERLGEIVNRPVHRLMTTKLQTVTKDVPVMRALSLMFVNEFSHLPVVKEDNSLMGIISQGDIFRALVSGEVAYSSEEEYHDWLAYHDDFVVKGARRHDIETQNVLQVFQKLGVKKVLDLGCGPGRHALLLAQYKIHVVGIETSKRMYGIAEKHRRQLPLTAQPFVSFIRGDNLEEVQKLPDSYDAAIFMGNALAHLYDSYEKVLSVLNKKLPEKNGLLLIQLMNFEKVFTTNKRFLTFNIQPSKLTPEREYAFIDFYDPARKSGDPLTLNMAILQYNGKRWISSGTNSTSVAHITKEKIEGLLKKNGFTNLKFYGSNYKEPLFEEKFDVTKHDWLNIVARR
ncbi:CBS domain-containing protein [Candidatus Roizmanbacteria bacterium]|nr:CBS domain-containing protein [Candidatus Roizmanbacteria bacterium]